MKLDVEDDRAVQLLRFAIGFLLLAGALAFVTEGANGPADPVLAAQCGGRQVTLDGVAFGEVAVRVHGPVKTVDGCVLVADSPQQHGHGLMGVTDKGLGGHVGMLFRFSGETTGAFYMFRTRLPLSIAWFDGDGQLVSSTDMPPCRKDVPGACPTYRAKGPYRFALEVPKGRLDDLGIDEGARLEVVGGP
jgi:uncharacterized membrane protein (UPF0127 family)